ncbi:sugar ABC transporter substrate-binding protein [Shouchella patagoniensis]|uniref:sugar ABC transporter substrate-binding protein n=1 Tax=Shouchella patagoniensis TaxID=228576 RepID=UPI0009955F0C|nr:extracellular solute-binding protein [Shouchella patagoniensis]
MNKWKQSISVLAVIGLLGACGPDRTGVVDELEPEEATEANKPDSLSIWVNDDERSLVAYREIGDQFELETGIEVRITPFSMGDQLEAMSLDAPAGGGPDLFYQPHDMVGNITLQGLAAEIELTAEEQAGYIDGSLEALSYEGELVGIPASVETYALFYNTDIVEEAPETVEELEQLGESFTDSNADEYGFLLESREMYFSYPLYEAYGGYIFAEEGDEYNTQDIGLDNEGAIAGGELMQSWYEKGYLPHNLNADILNGLFLDGSVGAVFSGPWNIAEYGNTLGESVKTAPLPTINGEHMTSLAGVKAWMVNGYSDHISWAKELALFMTNEESANTFFEHTREIPARAEVNLDEELYDGFVEQLEYAYFMPNVPEVSAVWGPMGDANVFISQGEDVEDVLTETVQMIQDEIEIMGAGK